MVSRINHGVKQLENEIKEKMDANKTPSVEQTQTTTFGKNSSIALIIKELERLFDLFNRKFFESALSRAVITMSQKGTKAASGWCSKEEVWQGGNSDRYYEINICPEYLNQPIDDICETLIHEMVHLYNALNKIEDCSRASQYHNIKYKEAAERFGLNVEKDKSRGYAETSLKPETREYIESLNLAVFDLFRDSIEVKRELKPSSTKKYSCPHCQTSIRATKEVKVKCVECDVLFIIA